MLNYANEQERIAMNVSFNSIMVNLALSVGKLVAGFVGQSAAMISDGIHSASDVLSTFVVMAGVKLSNKEADDDHQYGHERMECIASILLAGFLAFVGAGIGYSGYEKIINANEIEIAIPGQMALWAAVISTIVKEAMYWYTLLAAKKINSGALKADAWHHRTDAISSVGAFIGILGARMGYPILDPAASIVICFMIFYAAYEVFEEAMDKMTDHVCNEEMVAALKEAVVGVQGVDHLDSLATRQFGNRAYVDVEISVDDNLTLLAAHEIAENVHAAIETRFPEVKHCMVHVNPASEKHHDYKQPSQE